MKRVLWISRHKPLPKEEEAVRRLHGSDAVIVQDGNPFSSADDIVGRYRKGGYADLLVIAPLSMIQQLVDRGVRPLWAQTEQLPPGSPEPHDFVHSGMRYRFVGLRRVKRLALEFEDP